jgi:excisionase family DNA binding protein
MGMAQKISIKYLKVKKVAEALDASEDFVRNLVNNGDLEAIRMGTRSLRISEKSFYLYLDSIKIQPEEYYGL